jgi:hypothetical protein
VARLNEVPAYAELARVPADRPAGSFTFDGDELPQFCAPNNTVPTAQAAGAICDDAGKAARARLVVREAAQA